MFGAKKENKSDFVIEEDNEGKSSGKCVVLYVESSYGSDESEFIKSLQINLSRLIAYAESADVRLQREVLHFII
jgi:hypothetical protein